MQSAYRLNLIAPHHALGHIYPLHTEFLTRFALTRPQYSKMVLTMYSGFVFNREVCECVITF